MCMGDCVCHVADELATAPHFRNHGRVRSAVLEEALRATSKQPFVYSSAASNIPPLVHLTWKTADLPWIGRKCLQQWRTLNPDHHVLLWTDDDMEEFFERFFPQWHPVLMSLNKPVLRADYFRYMVLYTFGGVYADIDACPLKPVANWLTAAEVDNRDSNTPIGLVVGPESDSDLPQAQRNTPRQIQICQWTIAGTPGHPILARTIHQSTRRLERIYRDLDGKWDAQVLRQRVMDLTGPALFTDMVIDYFKQAGQDISFSALHELPRPRQIDDVLFLTITGFSPGLNEMNSQPPSHPQALVQHHYQGSWKKAE
ncbi:hypothetical protein RI367_007795 [Sorochytrium milnesiophthora]